MDESNNRLSTEALSLEELGGELTNTTNNVVELQNKIAEQTANLQTQLKQLQDWERDVRVAIQQAMEDNGVKKWANDSLSITYVPASTRTGIDLDQIRTHHPDLAKKYEKITNVKASVRIKVM